MFGTGGLCVPVLVAASHEARIRWRADADRYRLRWNRTSRSRAAAETLVSSSRYEAGCMPKAKEGNVANTLTGRLSYGEADSAAAGLSVSGC